jgi:hypothetical protein
LQHHSSFECVLFENSHGCPRHRHQQQQQQPKFSSSTERKMGNLSDKRQSFLLPNAAKIGSDGSFQCFLLLLLLKLSNQVSQNSFLSFLFSTVEKEEEKSRMLEIN